MKTIILVLLVSCVEPTIDLTPDPEFGPHDQVTTCDLTWSADGVAPGLCDHACRIKPDDPIIPVVGDPHCKETGRPCPILPGCKLASSPSTSPADCSTTFYAGPGVTGCCLTRSVEGIDTPVPTFYQCR